MWEKSQNKEFLKEEGRSRRNTLRKRRFFLGISNLHHSRGCLTRSHSSSVWNSSYSMHSLWAGILTISYTISTLYSSQSWSVENGCTTREWAGITTWPTFATTQTFSYSYFLTSSPRAISYSKCAFSSRMGIWL